MTTIQPPEARASRVSGRTTNYSETSELMRALLGDIPDADQRHLVDVVDRNHADQLARKRRARAGSALDETVEQVGDEGDDY